MYPQTRTGPRDRPIYSSPRSCTRNRTATGQKGRSGSTAGRSPRKGLLSDLSEPRLPKSLLLSLSSFVEVVRPPSAERLEVLLIPDNDVHEFFRDIHLFDDRFAFDLPSDLLIAPSQCLDL